MSRWTLKIYEIRWPGLMNHMFFYMWKAGCMCVTRMWGRQFGGSALLGSLGSWHSCECYTYHPPKHCSRSSTSFNGNSIPYLQWPLCSGMIWGNQRHGLGLQIFWISVWSNICGMWWTTSAIVWGTVSQLKLSAANVLVPEKTPHLQRPCGVHSLTGHSCFGRMLGS